LAIHPTGDEQRLDAAEFRAVSQGNLIDVEFAGFEFFAFGWQAVDRPGVVGAEHEVNGGVGAGVASELVLMATSVS
jgi:hypothetical protein